MNDRIRKLLKSYDHYIIMAVLTAFAVFAAFCLLAVILVIVPDPPQRAVVPVKKTQQSPHVNRFGQPCAMVQFSGPISFIDCQNSQNRKTAD